MTYVQQTGFKRGLVLTSEPRAILVLCIRWIGEVTGAATLWPDSIISVYLVYPFANDTSR